MSNAANIQLLLESLEALNARDADRFMATIHEDVTWSLDATKDPISGPEALRTVVEAMIAAFESNTAPARSGSPGAMISSPVERIATRG